MPYIGNPIYQSAFVTDQFSGDGTTVAFTMAVAPAGTSNVLVVVSGVVQDPSTYGVVGNTLTFSAAPPSGTGNISCRYLGVPVTGVVTTAYRTVTEFTATASQTTFTPPSYTVGYINVYLNGVLLGSADYTATNGTTVVLATGASAGNLVTVESFRVDSVLNALPTSGGTLSGTLNLASGLTLAGSAGTVGQVLTSQGSGTTPAWVSFPYTVEYLVVAAGGGGGADLAAGGGAGGYVTSSVSLLPSTAYTVTVGAGGAGGTPPRETSSSYGKDGAASSVSGSNISTISTIGGGGGGTYYGGNATYQSGRSGGSGGGVGAGTNTTCDGATVGAGTAGQGYAGGQGYGGSPYIGGGGGGAGAVGTAATSTVPGNGGAGLNWLSLGTYYAGGGGGSNYGSGGGAAGGTGGVGGGGAGGYGASSPNCNGVSGTANTGGGGGGASWTGTAPGVGGNGGSGVVIFRYLGAQHATGGTVTSSGGYTYHTFTTSGTFTA